MTTMNCYKDSIFHDGTEQFCRYDKENNEYIFILRTAKQVMGSVYMVMDNEPTLMTRTRESSRFAYYYVGLKLDTRLHTYHFVIEGNEKLYYNAAGANSALADNFEFQITPGFNTPDWAKGAVMYQIYTDRFCNGDKANDVVTNEYAYIGKGVTAVEDWHEAPAADGTRQFYGGDLQGIIHKLDYLQKLGVQVLYLNPIFVSPSNHKYDTQDYDFVDPHFGRIVKDGGAVLQHGDIDNMHAEKYMTRVTERENLEASNEMFIELVEELHNRGMKIIIDGVFNHCGSFNKWMDHEGFYKNNGTYDSGAYWDRESKYNSFFKFTSDGWPKNNNYEGWWGFDTLPKLNYENSKELEEYIINIAVKWVSPPFNVDGWRLDVAADLGHSQEFNHEFWRKFRKAVKAANKDAIILAEHYGDANSWLQGDQWDTVMNYDAFMDPVTWFLTGVDKHSDEVRVDLRGNADSFMSAMTYHMSRFQSQSLLVAMNELSNHDHSRFMTRTNKMAGRVASMGTKAAEENVDKAIFKQGVVMQMTLPGAPTLYYGDEAGLCGWTDPDNRRTYPWGKEDFELMEFYREMIFLHKDNKELRTGSYKPLKWGKDFLAYGRFNEENATVVVINTADEAVKCEVPVWQLNIRDGEEMERLIETSREFYNAGRVKCNVEDGMISFEIPGSSAVVYRTRR